MKVLVEKKADLGEYGSASVAVTSEAKIQASVTIEVNILKELEKLAAKTQTTVDDEVVKYIENLVAAANAVMV